MSNSDQNAVTTEPALTKLDILKARADELGMSYHPSIGEATLKTKLDKFVKEHTTKQKPVKPIVQPQVVRPLTARELKNMRIKEATRLVRVRLTCMDPAKKDWEGEIFTVSNSIVPTIKKYIPFNAEDGWHIPQMMLNMLREKKCTVFKTVKGPRGEKIRKSSDISTFAIEELPPLTRDELKDLAKRQAMAGNIG